MTDFGLEEYVGTLEFVESILEKARRGQWSLTTPERLSAWLEDQRAHPAQTGLERISAIGNAALVMMGEVVK